MSAERVVTWRKRWCRPRFKVYTPADKGPRLLLNKYGDVNRIGGVTIGICAVLFRRAWSLTWAKPVSHQEQLHE